MRTKHSTDTETPPNWISRPNTNQRPQPHSAGELTQEKLEEVIAIVSNPPKAFKIPDWFLNRQRDWKTGKSSQATSNVVDTKLREDLERLKKVRCVTKQETGFGLIGWTQLDRTLTTPIPHTNKQLEPRYPPLLGRARARAAHQDHGPPRQDGGAGREGEVRMES